MSEIQINPTESQASKKNQKICTKIEQLQKQTDELLKAMAISASAKEREQAEKKIAKLKAKTNDLKIRTTPDAHRSASEKLYLKNKLYRNLLICLLAVILFLTAVCVIVAYNNAQLRKSWASSVQKSNVLEENNRLLTQETVALQAENDQLTSDLSNAQSGYDDLAEDYEYLQSKAEWFDKNARIVIADEGYLYMTYHKYDCDLWDDSSYWIHNIEWVENDPEYTECSSCH